LRYENGVSKIRVKMLGFVSNTKQKMFIYGFFKEEEIEKNQMFM
jgi:hypothetical protein